MPPLFLFSALQAFSLALRGGVCYNRHNENVIWQKGSEIMRNFQDEINLGSTHTTIPNKVPIPERPDVDRPRRKPLWRNPIAWIVAIMLPITIIAFLACTLFTPTVSKLNRRIRYKNFSVTVSGPGDSTELKIKGNVIAKDMGDGDYVYYEIEDGKLYRYVPYNTG